MGRSRKAGCFLLFGFAKGIVLEGSAREERVRRHEEAQTGDSKATHKNPVELRTGMLVGMRAPRTRQLPSTHGASSPMLVVLNGYPGSHDLLVEQARTLMAEGSHTDLLLTSHLDATLSADPPLSAKGIPPHHFCSAPAVGTHKHFCNRPEADNKFLGAVFLANTTRHGFDWLLLGDDDTTFFLEDVRKELGKYDPNEPFFLGTQLGKRGTATTPPEGYMNALDSCPELGDPAFPRWASFNTEQDVSDVYKDCEPTAFRDDSWFGWAKGGDGIILSRGALDKIPAANWQKCVDRMHSFGGDVRIGMCLAMHGVHVKHLAPPPQVLLSKHKLFRHHGEPALRHGLDDHASGFSSTMFSTEGNAALTIKEESGISMDTSRQGTATDLHEDKLFHPTWEATPGTAKSVLEDCGSWVGEGLHCETEYPEHALVRKWVPEGATVMEFGARFGTTSCELAKQTGNSGNVVVVEPDLGVWDDLEQNLRSHRCNARVLRGAVSSSPVRMHPPAKNKGYAARTEAPGQAGKDTVGVPWYSFDAVEEAMGRKVDTLLIDCEGCAQFMMDQIGPKIKDQIDLVLIEGDMPLGAKDCHANCMNYTHFFEFLEESGLEMVDKFNDCDKDRTGAPPEKWCGKWIDHFAFRRKRADTPSARITVARPRASWSSATNFASGHQEISSTAERQGSTSDLQEDALFRAGWASSTEVAKTVSDACPQGWSGAGLHCETEMPEHRLVRDWVPADATVMEFGARFGTTSCELAKKTNNSGNVIVVEPDMAVWDDLERNLRSHRCNSRMLRGVISSVPVHMAPKGYASRTVVGQKGVAVPWYSFDTVEEALGKQVDTLLIDCEGCAQFMMDQIGPKIRTQINLILIEGDMPLGAKDCHSNCMDYQKFFKFLTEAGFEMVENFNDCEKAKTGAPAGTWCGTWINHYAFKRVRPASSEVVPHVLPPVAHPGATLLAGGHHNFEVSQGTAAVLKEDALFANGWAASSEVQAKGVSEACPEGWSGEGLHCETEFPEHALVRQWVPHNATIVEFGARFGTTSCELAKQTRNSGNVVVVEPDMGVWGDLEANLRSHQCNARVLRGAISSSPLRMHPPAKNKGYAARTEAPGQGGKGTVAVPWYSFDAVEEALGRKVDTLLIDCEGCAQFMMDQLGPKIKSQINLLLIEGDMPLGAKDCHANCMDYEKFFRFLEDSGLKQVDRFNDCDKERTGAPKGKWCGKWIDHYAFKRM